MNDTLKAEPTDTYTAVDMATAAAQGFRDGQAAADPAPAQDEREAFEAHMRLGGYSNPEKHQDGSYVSSAMELWWQGWKARATRPAQPEQQPGKVMVSADPLRRVLNALVNAPHQIRELQATREPVSLFADNPINILIAEYNAAHGDE